MQNKCIALFAFGLLIGCTQGNTSQGKESVVSSRDDGLPELDSQADQRKDSPMDDNLETPIRRIKAGNNSSATFQTALQTKVGQAKDDLAQRLLIPLEEIRLLEVREVVWPDSSLGCPQQGMAYAQVLQQGLLIRLRVENDMYLYHSGESREPFLCEDTTLVLPETTGRDDEFVPPPGSPID